MLTATKLVSLRVVAPASEPAGFAVDQGQIEACHHRLGRVPTLRLLRHAEHWGLLETDVRMPESPVMRRRRPVMGGHEAEPRVEPPAVFLDLLLGRGLPS